MNSFIFYKISENNLWTSADSKERKYIIKDLAPEEKPREKLLRYGPSVLSSAELLAIIFSTGTKRENVLKMSHRILKEYGSKAVISQTNPHKLAKELEIPLIKACQMVACFELGRRFFKEQKGKRLVTIRSAKDVARHLQGMAELDKETLVGLYLNSRSQIIHEEIISIGSLTTNIIHPREVLKPAVELSAAAVILVHNHPSGSVTPSEEDIKITKQIVEAGKILGIEILDHIIIGKGKYKSILN